MSAYLMFTRTNTPRWGGACGIAARAERASEAGANLDAALL